MPKRLKRLINRALSRFGYRIVRTHSGPARYSGPSFDARQALPSGAAERLREDHPRLLELRRRYAACRLPMATHSVWAGGYLARELDLRYFRGDNAYVWQFRNVGQDERRKYYLYAQYVAARDPRGLLRQLGEDGLFGCWVFEYESLPAVSRDLLESINEMYFLDRHWNLFGREGFTVLDIGAGYGRLADRMVAASRVDTYYCVDAVPESTFLSEYYLHFRGREPRAVVVPLDELDRLAGKRVDLALNIHSFSEMPVAAIEGWVALAADAGAGHFLIVPNLEGRTLSAEPDGTRVDFAPVLARHGYRLVVDEPVIRDADLRALIGIRDRILLFARA